jgi:hypothetical protein
MYNISQKQIIISDRKYAIQALVEYLSTVYLIFWIILIINNLEKE